jgi:hypothetical protein
MPWNTDDFAFDIGSFKMGNAKSMSFFEVLFCISKSFMEVILWAIVCSGYKY